MGTRADFYVGRGPQAEWLGSVAYDGHPGNFPKIVKTKTEKAYRAAVKKELAGRDDSTKPEEGWPWPWEDSGTSDYAFAFDEGEVFHTQSSEHGSGEEWVKVASKPNADGYKPGGVPAVHPNMKHRMKVKPLGTQGSGAMLFTLRR